MSDRYWTVTVRIPKPTRRWFKMSLRRLLLVVVILGAGLGFAGRYWQRRYIENQYKLRTYRITKYDLNPASPNANRILQSLMTRIESELAPATWRNAGGYGSMQFNPTGYSLTVRQKEEILEQIDKLITEEFANLRTENRISGIQGLPR